MSRVNKRIAARRQRNAELARLDASHRCGYCRNPLPVKVFLTWADPQMYCSEACRDDAAAAKVRPPSRWGT